MRRKILLSSSITPRDRVALTLPPGFLSLHKADSSCHEGRPGSGQGNFLRPVLEAAASGAGRLQSLAHAGPPPYHSAGSELYVLFFFTFYCEPDPYRVVQAGLELVTLWPQPPKVPE